MEEKRALRILVIDDDPFFCGFVRAHLSHAGYQVEVAEDAVEGGKALLRPQYDLILCDINMPFMTGLGLASALRATPETAAIPVIFASARTDAKTKAEAQELGAAAYLTKPIQAEQLLEAVMRCLDARGSGDGDAGEPA